MSATTTMERGTSCLCWTEQDETHCVPWISSTGVPPPKRIVVIDDKQTADASYRLACEGNALLWRGDFQSAKHHLQAMGRRFDRDNRTRPAKMQPSDFPQAFHHYRMRQAQRARALGRLVICVDAGHVLKLRRAPDFSRAGVQAYGVCDAPYVLSLRELLGVIGAYEWRKNGLHIDALAAKIFPHYGVFSPVRGEYVKLVEKTPLPCHAGLGTAFDIGTGTGVLAALLAKRGVARIVATDCDERALACAAENIDGLGFSQQINLLHTDLFPPGRADLIVCNPPWLPGRATSALERAIYDPESRMLKQFILGLAAHLEMQGEAWLILSDLAERLGLRSREVLLHWFEQGGIKFLEKIDIKPTHSKSQDSADPLYFARSTEITSLWRLARKEDHEY